jgi:hypothetical protein
MRRASIVSMGEWPMYYDRLGVPIELMEWAGLLEDREYARIAESTVGPYLISTVWLGLDQNFLHIGPPIIFETMVFAHVSGDLHGDLETRRYFTEGEARVGHEEMVQLVEVLENVSRVDG